MNAMICFEVSGKQEKVRKILTSKGYMANWKVKRGKDELTFHLPANALWKKGENFSPARAKEDLQKAAKDENVKVLRAVAMVVSKWDAVTGSPVTAGSSVQETEEISS